MGDLSALLNDSKTNIADCQFSIQHLSELIQLIENGTISGKIAKSVIASSFDNGKMPSQIVDEEGLSQISDSSEIEGIVDEVISANQESAQDYINGKKKALGFLVGQVMKATKGKANPKLVNQILTQKLTGE
jgi:aspartyl-tRNA(Asn)/glutamyl-tRNA(Gln) amidotransferase subunit B